MVSQDGRVGGGDGETLSLLGGVVRPPRGFGAVRAGGGDVAITRRIVRGWDGGSSGVSST